MKNEAFRYSDESTYKDIFWPMKFGVSINNQIQRSQQQMEKIQKKSNAIHSVQFYLSSGFASILMGSMKNKLIQAQEFQSFQTICSKWSLSHALFLSRSHQHILKHLKSYLRLNV